MTPAPNTKHQNVLSNLLGLLRRFSRDQGLGKVLPAPVDVVLSEDNVVQPDLLFIAKSRLAMLTKENVRGAPDLVVEILSPSSKDWDTRVKRGLYEKYGVREYWIVDPDAESVEVLQLTDDGFVSLKVHPKGTHLQSPLLEGFAPSVDLFFAD